MRKLVILGSVLALVLAFTGIASADTYVDFRTFSLTDGVVVAPYTEKGVTVGCGPDDLLYWTSEDGFGVAGHPGYEGDEVETPEWLTLTFNDNVRLESVDITNLFYENVGTGDYFEIGWYKLGENDPWIAFTQDDITKTMAGSNGEYTLEVNAWVDTIWFSAPGLSIDGQKHEFSVAGVNIVPIPGAVWLLGSGLIGLAGLRRRKS